MSHIKQIPLERLNYSGELETLVVRICSAYSIGKPIDFNVIEIGYEDCNVAIHTNNGTYVAKIFSKKRTDENRARYGTIMQKVLEAGVRHPPLIATQSGGIIYSDNTTNGISMVLMKFVDGKTFLELKRAPNEKELELVIEQAAKINAIDYRPSYYFDSWAIPNIEIMLERVKRFITPDDLRLGELALARYKEIPIGHLPHCFVHGDFTKANVMKGDDGDIFILDFSVANWYPRIQELAVIAANLLYEERTSLSLREKCQLVVEKYNAHNHLTADEEHYLTPYALAGIAMEFMGAHQEKFINGNDTEETDYWLNLGRNGLRNELVADPLDG